ncbi:hypothetical protein T10_1301 [Trichinella papuae]|uniref:HTH CENPB-type domain-containing protein n=1 Tax=Trichinella papuae TaxID=268474 RepID=A0A0V1M3J8_9BILA|nr:hypothetical protein T10_1301 [Trichinella papuae]
MSAVKAASNASYTFSTLDLSWEVSCRYTAKTPPVNRSKITLATSLISRSLHNISTCSSYSTTHCWCDPSNSGIRFRAVARCGYATLLRLALYHKRTHVEENSIACEIHGCCRQCIKRCIWKNRSALLDAHENGVTCAKRFRLCEKTDIDEALLQWFREQSQIRTLISEPILKIKAEQFATVLGYSEGFCKTLQVNINVAFTLIEVQISSCTTGKELLEAAFAKLCLSDWDIFTMFEKERRRLMPLPLA